jgi:hypothetical protein
VNQDDSPDHKDNDDFCVDFMDEEDNWREVFLLSEKEC